MNNNTSRSNSTNAGDINEFSRSVQQLGSRYVAEYTSNVKRYAEFVDSLLQRNVDQTLFSAPDPELQKRYAEFVLHESPHILGRIAEAGL